MRRQGFGLVEVLVALAIIGVALIPVLGLATSTGRGSAFTQAHTFWDVRACRLLESLSMCDYDALLGARYGDGLLKVKTDDEALPAEYLRMFANHQEVCRMDEMAPGLSLITVTISWSFPTRPDQRHFVEQRRLVTRPTLTWQSRDALELAVRP